VYVTHDQEEALSVSDRVAVMAEGSAEQVAPPRDIYRRPASRFVAEFVGDNNVFEGAVRAVDDSTATVAVGGESLIVGFGDGTERPAVGDRLVFCVRPETMTVDGGRNRLAATAESSEVLGETTRTHLGWAGRDLQIRTTDPLSGTVTVGFDPADASIVESGG
jgi:thiamine transport system ATP-binding protein